VLNCSCLICDSQFLKFRIWALSLRQNDSSPTRNESFFGRLL